MFKVNISIRVTEDGKEFSEYSADYSNMDYNDMQTAQGTVIKALVALGDAGMVPVAKVPATT